MSSSFRPFHVKKRTLLAIAGCVWLAAGFNVARLGVLSYCQLDRIRIVHILLSMAVFCVFGFMFFMMGGESVLGIVFPLSLRNCPKLEIDCHKILLFYQNAITLLTI